MASRAENYLAHLDRLSGGIEPRFLPVASTHDGWKGVTVITYKRLPDDLTTSLTYGLSLADHPDWRLGRPELCLSVRSDDDSWAWAVGQLAEGLRGTCPFSYGNTVDLGEPVSPDSAMTAFLVFAPAVLDRADCRIDVGPGDHEGRDVIHLVGVYPPSTRWSCSTSGPTASRRSGAGRGTPTTSRVRRPCRRRRRQGPGPAPSPDRSIAVVTSTTTCSHSWTNGSGTSPNARLLCSTVDVSR